MKKKYQIYKKDKISMVDFIQQFIEWTEESQPELRFPWTTNNTVLRYSLSIYISICTVQPTIETLDNTVYVRTVHTTSRVL